MKTFAASSNGVVIDVTVTPGFTPPPREGVPYIECPSTVCSGDLYDGVVYSRDGVTLVEPTPETIPLWAFRASLALVGIQKEAVLALIDALPEPQKTVANIQWEYGNFIDRVHPLINQLGGALGLTEEQINEIFRVALTLT
jgi:hypothetical protein